MLNTFKTLDVFHSMRMPDWRAVYRTSCIERQNSCIDRAWYKRVRIRSGAVNEVEQLVCFRNNSRIMVSPCQITGDMQRSHINDN